MNRHWSKALTGQMPLFRVARFAFGSALVVIDDRNVRVPGRSTTITTTRTRETEANNRLHMDPVRLAPPEASELGVIKGTGELFMSGATSMSRGRVPGHFLNSYRITPGLLSLLLAVTLSVGAQTEVSYGVGSWKHVLGSHRAVVRVDKKAEAVWVHIPWRRRDPSPEKKAVIVVDLKSGRRIRNVACVNLTSEFGDIVFQADEPGEYAVYYLPLERVPRRPTGTCDFRYMKPFSFAEPVWLDRNGLGESRYLESDFREKFATAKVVRIEARSEFDRFDPMEIVATKEELARLRGFYPNRKFLLFPESRKYPIRMLRNIPLRWIRSGPSDSFAATAERNEFFVFQVGVYAIGGAVKNLRVDFGELRKTDGTSIPSSAFRCFNLSGIDALGRPFTKKVNVRKRHVQPLWIGVQIPLKTIPGEYLSTIRIGEASGEMETLRLRLNVRDEVLKDGGVGDLWRFARLKWLDSTAGENDRLTRPYTAMHVAGRTIACTNKTVVLNEDGLPERILCGKNEILAKPIRFAVEPESGAMDWGPARCEIIEKKKTHVRWISRKASKKAEITTNVRMEYDGYAFYSITLKALANLDLKDVVLEIFYKKAFATYMMGLDSGVGGYRRKDVLWKWENHPNNKVWIGDVEGGLRCKLRGPAAFEDVWAEYTPEANGIPRSWGNSGKGGASVQETSDGNVVFRAFSGPRSMKKGETLEFNFSLLPTPVKPRDPKHWCDPRQWSWRYSMLTKDPALVNKLGANILTAFHGSPQNPFINYPFKAIDRLEKWIDETHKMGMRAKMYYTVGELSNHAAELWCLRSLNGECLQSGKGGGGEWLREHLVHDYQPKWYCTPFGIEGDADASIALTGMNRWFNYYVESVKWLAKTKRIDGIFYDGARFSRRILRRVRNVLDEVRPGALLDYHAGNNITRRSNTYNDAMEHLPYLDSTWIGEGFNYNRGPDFYMVELSGIPFGVPNNMLEGGGNPWRGMVYGMGTRYIENHAGAPTTLWKFWDDFKIQDTRMIGYWDKKCPVKTNREDVLATVFKGEGKSLIALGSWAKSTVSVRLNVDWSALGLNPKKVRIYAPSIPEFQEERIFKTGKNIEVPYGRGWLIVLDTEGALLSSSASSGAEKLGTLFADSLTGGVLGKGWTERRTEDVEAEITPTPKGVVISGPSDSEVWLERPLPAGAAGVECDVYFPLDTPIWRRRRLAGLQAPGLGVAWKNGKAVRISFAGKGAFTIDDNIMDHMYRFVPSIMLSKRMGWVKMRIVWDREFVKAQVSANARTWETLRAIPRSVFPAQPAIVRIGKMGKHYGWPRTMHLEGEKAAQEATFKNVRILGAWR